MLEEQLETARRRSEQIVELETTVLKYRQQINELTMVRLACGYGPITARIKCYVTVLQPDIKVTLWSKSLSDGLRDLMLAAQPNP